MPTFIAAEDFKISIVEISFVFNSLHFFLRIELNSWAVPTLQDRLSYP
jgi:hypothetical protein